jgi:cephalosporin hydroxylase
LLPPRVLDAIARGTSRYSYKGVVALKDPFDLALYSLLIWRLKPRTIVEIGTNLGGTTLWLADQLVACEIDGVVHSLDLHPVDLPPNPRIRLHVGDARRMAECFPADWITAQPRPLLVIDDGDHTYTSVLLMLEHFGPQLRSGEYIVVEDGIVDDLAMSHKFEGGPRRAIAEFLARGAPFEIDRSYCDFFGRNVTWNIDGYLRRR